MVGDTTRVLLTNGWTHKREYHAACRVWLRGALGRRYECMRVRLDYVPKSSESRVCVVGDLSMVSIRERSAVGQQLSVKALLY